MSASPEQQTIRGFDQWSEFPLIKVDQVDLGTIARLRVLTLQDQSAGSATKKINFLVGDDTGTIVLVYEKGTAYSTENHFISPAQTPLEVLCRVIRDPSVAGLVLHVPGESITIPYGIRALPSGSLSFLPDHIRITDNVSNGERSYGAILLRPRKNTDTQQYEMLLIRHRGKVRHWGFPKGRPEGYETARLAACRELSEETGIKKENYRLLIDVPPFTERYMIARPPKPPRIKVVTYFLAMLIDKEGADTVRLQESEVDAYEWATIPRALELLRPESHHTIRHVAEVLTHLL